MYHSHEVESVELNL